MKSTLSFNDLRQMIGTNAYDIEGNKVGGIEEIFTDMDSGEPEWLGVKSGGLFGSKHVVVPIDGADRFEDGIRVRYSQDVIKDAPEVEQDEISYEQEAEIYRHYGLSAHDSTDTSRMSDPGLMDRGTTREIEHRGRDDEAHMTRSEEQLNVGKREVNAGQVRLRKYVDTEPVSADVDLRTETARVERHEVNRPVAGAEIGEQEATMDLHREEPVVQKESVVREEVSLSKDEETERETISDEVRKERIDVDGDSKRQR